MNKKRAILGTAFALALGWAPACGGSDEKDDTLGAVGGTTSTAFGGKGGATGGASGTTGGKGGSDGVGGSGVGGSAASTATGGNGSSVGGTGGVSSSAGGTGGTTVSGDACPGLPFDDADADADAGGGSTACRGISYEAEAAPVDLFIMMDRSVSLSQIDPVSGHSRWDLLRLAMGEFVVEAANQDLRLGIGFFGRTGGNDDALDCDVSYYAKPAVEIGKVSDVGGDILNIMEEVEPNGFTPTAPALEGALAHAGEWAQSNPGRVIAVVLVTDGYPTQCEPRGISSIAELAETAHMMEPYVRTYVIGLAAKFNLDGIARSGGTNKAYVVDEGDSTASFLTALRNVSSTKLACRYEIPDPSEDGMKIDFDEVQVTYTPGDAPTEEVPRINDYSACTRNPNGGWYYDDPTAPTQILVCPCTCSRFDAGRVDVALGCKPQVGIR